MHNKVAARNTQIEGSKRADPEGSLRQAKAWSDATPSLIFIAIELTEELEALVAPPRKNQILFHGVLAANCALRMHPRALVEAPGLAARILAGLARARTREPLPP